jgi:hypothetical protein
MATVHLLSNFYFDRLEPGRTYGYWAGPADVYRNATITVTAHAYEGIGPSQPLTMRTEMVGLEIKGTTADRIVWFEVTNTSPIPIRSFHVYFSAVTN